MDGMKQQTKPHISFYRVGDSSFARIDVSHVPIGWNSFHVHVSDRRWGKRNRAIRRLFDNVIYAAGVRGYNALTGQALPTVPWDWSRGRPGAYPSDYQQYKACRLAEMQA
ncbi:hypothetical protein AB1286_29945 [Trinickia sp. NRRL B-1857]|uniref:hypothetical protein n=1 Tax=Trinickia sp. NRRL B-1857 TaxID=3162879 RepID=UPI003D2E86E9